MFACKIQVIVVVLVGGGVAYVAQLFETSEHIEMRSYISHGFSHAHGAGQWCR